MLTTTFFGLFSQLKNTMMKRNCLLLLQLFMLAGIQEVPAKGLHQVMDFIPPREPRIATSTITATLSVTCEFDQTHFNR